MGIPEEEYLDIVDEKGLPTGETVARSVAHCEDVRHRTAHVWILREKDGKVQILMQKRSHDKESFPDCFDTSSAGHIKAGDEPLRSAVRELGEELGIRAEESDLTFAGTFNNHYEREFYGKPFRDNEVTFVYVLAKDVEVSSLTLQKEEVSDAAWFDLDHVYGEKLKHNENFCVSIEGLRTLISYLKIDYQEGIK